MITYELCLRQPKTANPLEKHKTVRGPVPRVDELIQVPGGYENSYQFVYKVKEVRYLYEEDKTGTEGEVLRTEGVLEARVIVLAVFEDVLHK